MSALQQPYLVKNLNVIFFSLSFFTNSIMNLLLLKKNYFFSFIIFSLLIPISLSQFLPQSEVDTLQTIFDKLHVKDLNIDRSLCSNSRRNVTTENSVTNITCSLNGSVYHVTSIQLKGQNLAGTLPIEFANLSYLREIDLSRNYINGSIPPALSKLPLTILSLLGNRLTGSIPKEIGDISTLEELVLEENKLDGSLPQNLGSLSNLKKLVLSANNITGPIPGTFINLKNLEDFRIDGNGINGKIPDLIGNWTNIGQLDMQGTSMEGPIPDTISQLKIIKHLRLSDLNGPSSTFPDFKKMKILKTLILRNCKVTGPIPNYIGGLSSLKLIDLSFNMLTGEIPGSLQSSDFDYMFLNENHMSGVVPNWVLSSKNYIDISFNNFSGSISYSCHQASRVNVISSYISAKENKTEWCLKKDLPCSTSPKYYSLFINCGGRGVPYDGNNYEEDLVTDGSSSFFSSSSQNWAYSSSGVFMGLEDAPYLAKNTFSLNISGPDFYKTARLAPSSLKYYGLCLREGSYKVRLYFAEIMYSDDQTFSSLGNRIFDVSIQGNVVLKNFNIMEEAKGVGIGIFRDFDVGVNDSTLQIHLYWSGKGTTAIPGKGVYGPLISAISVKPNFDPHTGLSIGAIVGIVVGSCVFLALILVGLWMKGCFGGKDDENKEFRALLQTGYFSLRQIKTATHNFEHSNKIGEGGFGPVYKGVLPDGTVIAVKQLSTKSKQGNREFVNEIGMISALQHPNLVKLFGCCIEGNQLLLVYEYMENNSLARALFGSVEQRLNLDWPTRKKICIGIAKGLAYLHEESRLKIVHRDIKATNVLLNKDFNAKISDFGLAKLDEEENTHISTRIAGTIGYMAPEYAMRGYLTDKADVYSFGIVALEIVSGKSNTNYRPKDEFVYLLDWAYVLQEQGNLLELVDPVLGSNYKKKEATIMLNLGLMCANPSPTLRPSMSSVVSMLEGKTPVQTTITKPISSESDYLRFKAFEMLSQDSRTHVSSSSTDSHNVQRSSLSMEGPCVIDTTTSVKKKSDDYDIFSSDRPLMDTQDDVNFH